MGKDRFYTLFLDNTVLRVSLVIFFLCILRLELFKNIFCLSLIQSRSNLFAPGCQSKLLKYETGVKYVCKNVTRKHNFFGTHRYCERKNLTFSLSTPRKNQCENEPIYDSQQIQSRLIVFKCYNLFSFWFQWCIL